MTWIEVATILDKPFDLDGDLDDDVPPSSSQIAAAKKILAEVYKHEDSDTWPKLIRGNFCGKLDVTWRNTPKVIHLAWFSKGKSMLVTGDTSVKTPFEVKHNPAARHIIAALEDLACEKNIDGGH